MTIIYSFRQDHIAGASTHIDSTIGFTWAAYGLAILITIIFGAKINYQISGIILATTAIPTIVTGSLLRFRPIIIGGFCFILFAALAFLSTTYSHQFLIAALGIICGYLIPGYLLKKSEK